MQLFTFSTHYMWNLYTGQVGVCYFLLAKVIQCHFHCRGLPEYRIQNLVSQYTKVIFTTVHRKFALDGFNFKTVDYQLNPFTYEEAFFARFRP